MQKRRGLKEWQNTSLVLPSSGRAKTEVLETELSPLRNSEGKCYPDLIREEH